MKIVVATEGPDVTRIILPHARRFAEATGASIAVVRVLQPLLDLGSDRSLTMKDATNAVRARWEADQRAVLSEANIDGDVEIAVLGHGEEVSHAIIGAATGLGADVVALRSNNTGAIRHALFGNIGAAILRQTPFPVLAVGPKAEPPGASGQYHLLATDDDSKASTKAIGRLGALLGDAEVQVTLLRVREPARGESEEEAAAQLEALRGNFGAGQAVTTRVYRAELAGTVDNAIVAAAGDLRVDAIAMATHGHGMARHLLLGSVALDVASASRVPLLLFRAT